MRAVKAADVHAAELAEVEAEKLRSQQHQLQQQPPQRQHQASLPPHAEEVEEEDEDEEVDRVGDVNNGTSLLRLSGEFSQALYRQSLSRRDSEAASRRLSQAELEQRLDRSLSTRSLDCSLDDDDSSSQAGDSDVGSRHSRW